MASSTSTTAAPPSHLRQTLLTHVSPESSPAERGRSFGVAHASAIATTVRTYRRLFLAAAGVSGDEARTRGAGFAEMLSHAYPEVLAELEGMASGAGQHVCDLAAINARTELLAGHPRAECSVMGRRSGTDVRLAQTWDWHPELAPARVVWTVCPPGGAWFTTVTEAGILAKLGLNGQGVACALNFLSCSADDGAGGVPIHVLLRLILERAVDAAGAVALLCGARTSASSAITIAYAGEQQAELVAVELSPGGATVIRPDPDGWLIHTNHFVGAPSRGIDQEIAAGPGSALRRARLGALARGGAAPSEALADHLPHEDPICRHADSSSRVPWPERLATLLAIEIDPGAPSLTVAAGPPCAAPFAPVALPSATTPT